MVNTSKPEEKRMTITEHLAELRVRLIVSLATVALGSVLVYMRSNEVLEWLVKPIGRLVFISPTEPFSVRLRIAVAGGLLLALPVVLVELWLFILPGLYPHEARWGRRMLPVSVGLFIVGLGVAYNAGFPLIYAVLSHLGLNNVQGLLSLGAYASFVLRTTLALALLPQVCVISLIMVRLGVMGPQALQVGRKSVYLVAAIISACLTPFDSVTYQIFTLVYVVLIYQTGIILVKADEVLKRISKCREARRTTESLQ